MLFELDLILGEVWRLRLPIVVDEFRFEIGWEERMNPRMQSLYWVFKDQLHFELLQIKQRQDALNELLPERDRASLGLAWWRYRVQIEPTIPSLSPARMERPDQDKKPAAIAAPPSIAAPTHPDIHGFELPRDEARERAE